MTPQARVLGVIEVLEDFLETKKPADNILSNYLRTRRYIGSKDRRFISDFFWKTIRILAKLCWYIDLNAEKIFKNDARMIIISALYFIENQSIEEIKNIFNGLKYAPKELTDTELSLLKNKSENIPEHIKFEMPLWLYQKFKSQFKENTSLELNSLLEDANPVLRINTIKTSVKKYLSILENNNISFQECSIVPNGIILEKRIASANIPFFKEGYVEFQDEASQLVALLCAPEKNNNVLDFCAGAGGKTLAIAALMENQGEIIATDISKSQLDNIHKRIKRSGVNIIKPMNFNQYDELPDYFNEYFDIVLVDVPCSGTGTFRRSPDAKWRLNEKQISKLNNIQKTILKTASKMVKSGGKLVYATCSMLSDENESIINCFLENNDDFMPLNANEILHKITHNKLFSDKNNYLNLSPYKNNTDGFFAAIFEKK